MITYAWRNLWRNKKRTAITMAAVGFSTAILIMTYALMDGMVEQSVRMATDLIVGEAQVHSPTYLDDYSIYKSLENTEAIIRDAKDNSIDAAPRCYGYGLISVGVKSAGAMFCGVRPSLETKTFDLANYLAKGRFLADKPHNGIVLGKKLARSINANLGEEIVVLVQAADGSLGNELYTVVGILKACSDSIDRSKAFVHIDDFMELFSSRRIHEVAFNSHGRIPLKNLVTILKKISKDGEVKSWRQILPVFSDLINLTDVSIGLMGGIFSIAAALGVLNTLLMATYERIYEFGVIRALGASPWFIIYGVASEALMMAVLGTFIGVIFGLGISYYLQAVGFDTSQFVSATTSMGGVAFDPVWRASVSLRVVLWPVISMWVICLLSSIYPAVMAARLEPVKAMQHV